jgi:hypothetical protein
MAINESITVNTKFLCNLISFFNQLAKIILIICLLNYLYIKKDHIAVVFNLIYVYFFYPLPLLDDPPLEELPFEELLELPADGELEREGELTLGDELLLDGVDVALVF